MSKEKLLPIIIEREMEKLRQERETFNQNKTHEKLWFLLRIIMGYSSIILLFLIMIICSLIIFNFKLFSENIVTAASISLFGDILGLLICVWKIVLNPKSISKLEPSTKTIQSYDELLDEEKEN